MMRKLRCGRVLDSLCLFPYSSCFVCTRNTNTNYDDEKPLLNTASSTPPVIKDDVKKKLKDVLVGPPTLAFHLKPKIVVLRVSMHCNGCARKIEKHISKLEGVISYKVDLETKMVVVTGDIAPFQVLESVSKIKNAQLWDDQS
ncbi:hypothetical protein ABFS82_10G100000 [Erythranthe guttata]|uniref:HMA domain-containing protein n=1 Tax=Erythranthe guttata TaxID=4155 RepID=A0A022QIY3_ERYGU|nr:PREDICTED: uncharacterized protein LOC105969273 [Erythranthe guttata]EYU27243.1 hypothetical protein MIMGU_mgv1a015876mg [Erythranthe guttata]|eukprot:XP_012849475.1 PREDICTED: uncharacterized protein LOC105969273 [Erythranthe guttata]